MSKKRRNNTVKETTMEETKMNPEMESQEEEKVEETKKEKKSIFDKAKDFGGKVMNSKPAKAAKKAAPYVGAAVVGALAAGTAVLTAISAARNENDDLNEIPMEYIPMNDEDEVETYESDEVFESED